MYLVETEKLDIPFVKFNPLVVKDLENPKNTLILLNYLDFKTNILRYGNGRVIKRKKDVSIKFKNRGRNKTGIP